jgi:hypothetical protein
MQLTPAKAIEHYRALTSGPPAIPEVDVLNIAGEYLVGAHSWRYKIGRSVSLDLRGQIVVTGAVWSEADLTLTLANAFADYTFVVGDRVRVTAGANAFPGTYKSTGRLDDNTIILEDSIGPSATTGIDCTLDNDSTGLPADFAEFTAPRGVKAGSSTTAWTGLELVTLDDLLAMRAGYLGEFGGKFWGALTYPSTRLIAPTPVLDLHPIRVGGNVSGAFRCYYNAGWTELDSDGDLIALPAHLVPLYLELCVAVASSTTTGAGVGGATMGQAVAQILCDRNPATGGPTTYWMAKQRDGRGQPSFGTPSNGAFRPLGRRSERFLNTPPTV